MRRTVPPPASTLRAIVVVQSHSAKDRYTGPRVKCLGKTSRQNKNKPHNFLFPPRTQSQTAPEEDEPSPAKTGTIGPGLLLIGVPCYAVTPGLDLLKPVVSHVSTPTPLPNIPGLLLGANVPLVTIPFGPELQLQSKETREQRRGENKSLTSLKLIFIHSPFIRSPTFSFVQTKRSRMARQETDVFSAILCAL